jgi:phosphoribosylformylglycinamidine cyclo-ligase
MTESTGPAALSEGLTYAAAGVDAEAKDAGLSALLRSVSKTREFRKGVGATRLDVGFFANVIDLGHGQGLAISTDTVGTKALVAQMAGRYDTIGIDCVAINVNDVLCVGAEPIAMVDCISLEQADAGLLEGIGEGLYAGAERARVSIVGGELAQVRDMVKGYRPGLGFDLAGTCVGLVPLDRVVTGDSIGDGDVLIGLRSSGIHCNGLSLARKALLESELYAPDQVLPELGRTLAEELLEPTRIYVKDVMALLDSDVRPKALAHITGNGFMNLTRAASDVGYVIERLPEPHRIFDLIQKAGKISDAEMFRVYNMGIGFCVVVDPADVDATLEVLGGSGTECHVLGHAVPDARRRVWVAPRRLLGENGRFDIDR